MAVHVWMTDTAPKGKGFPGEKKNGKLGKNMPDIHHGVQERGEGGGRGRRERERERSYSKAQRKPGTLKG